MNRTATADLDAWWKRPRRKPLIVRGARQVGKSFLVRDFAASRNLALAELNFERDPLAARAFESGDVEQTARAIEALTGRRLRDETSLLFLDEIQAAPDVLARLRWFSEDRPRLAVIAAGSLLDFALAEHSFSMPVGRISYLHLEPMSFVEFLAGVGDGELAELVATGDPSRDFGEAVHGRLLERFREYVLVGGMPEAVEAYRVARSLLESTRIHHELLATFRDDFAKYAALVHRSRLAKVLDAVPRLLGRKFVYKAVDREERSAALRRAVDMLCMARVCHRVVATQATGVPLGAEVDDRRFKMLMLDVGLVSASLGLSLTDLVPPNGIMLVNEGGIAEQIVGQALRQSSPSFVDPSLHYWSRDTQGSEAEVDYVVQHGKTVVPVEVKAGATGTLRSLHVLMASRRWKRAVRFNADLPSTTSVSAQTRTGASAVYQLVSLPLYMASQLGRILTAT